jgi:hypothetical protein
MNQQHVPDSYSQTQRLFAYGEIKANGKTFAVVTSIEIRERQPYSSSHGSLNRRAYKGSSENFISFEAGLGNFGSHRPQHFTLQERLKIRASGNVKYK